LILSKKLVPKNKLESFPNLVHSFEAHKKLAKKTTPASSKFGIELQKYREGERAKKLNVQSTSKASSTIDGSGVKVNFKKWNDNLIF